MYLLYIFSLYCIKSKQTTTPNLDKEQIPSIWPHVKYTPLRLSLAKEKKRKKMNSNTDLIFKIPQWLAEVAEQSSVFQCF